MKQNIKMLLFFFISVIPLVVYYLFVFEYPKYARKLLEKKHTLSTVGVFVKLKENSWMVQTTQGNKLKTKNWIVKYYYKIEKNTYFDSLLVDVNALNSKEQSILKSLKEGSFVKIKYNPNKIQESFFCFENEYINK